MKIQQKSFMDSGQFVDLSNKMLAGYAMFANKASAAKELIKRKLVVQPAAGKTCRNMPGAFCVLKIIEKCEEGVDPTTLKMMTGFDNQKVGKILYKLFKHGKIRIEGGGLYTGVKKRAC